MTIDNAYMDSPDYFKNLISTLSPYRISTEEMDHPLDPSRNIPAGYTKLPLSPLANIPRTPFHTDHTPEDVVKIVDNATPLLKQYMDMADNGAVSRPAPFDWGSGTPQYLSEVLSESLPPQSLPYINMGAEAQRTSKINVDGNIFAADGSALPDAPVEMFRPGGNMDSLALTDPVFNWTNRAVDPTPDRFIEEETLMAVDIMSQLAEVGQQRELKTIWDEFDDFREELTFFSSMPKQGEPSFITQARQDPIYDNMTHKVETLTYRIISSMDYSWPRWSMTNLNDPAATEQGMFDTFGEHPSLTALNSLTGFNLSYEDSRDPEKVQEAVKDFAASVVEDAAHRQNIIRSLAVGRPIADSEIDFDAMSLVEPNPITELKIYDPETGEFKLMEVAEVLGSSEYKDRADQYRKSMEYRESVHRTLMERHEVGPTTTMHTETWGESLRAVLKDRYNRSGIVKQAKTPWGGEQQVMTRLATGEEHKESMDRRQEAINFAEASKYIDKSRGPEPTRIIYPGKTDYPADWYVSQDLLGKEPWSTAYSPMSAAYQPPLLDTWGWWIKPPSEKVQASALALMFPHRQSMEEYAEREAEEMRVLSKYLDRNISEEIEEYGDMSSSQMLLNQLEKFNYISSVLDRYIKQGDAGDDAFYAAQPFINAGLLSRDLTRDNYLDAMKELSKEYKQNMLENTVIYESINSPMSTYDTLMVAAMNEGLGTSFVNVNQVNELAFATVLDKDKFSRAERLNILRTWNMAHTTFVKTIEDQNADAMIAATDVNNWNQRNRLGHDRSIWNFSGLDSGKATRNRIAEGDPIAVAKAQSYLTTINNNYVNAYKDLNPDVQDDQIPPSPFSLTTPLDWRGMPINQANAALRALTQTYVENPLEEGQPIQLKNLTSMIDEGMSYLGDRETLMGDGPEAEARRNVASRALLYIGYFGELVKTNPDVRQHATAFGFTENELIASNLIMSLARDNNPNLGVFELDIMMSPEEAMQMITVVNDETRGLYELLSTTYEGNDIFDRGIREMFMAIPSDLESIPWSWNDPTDYLTQDIGQGRTRYQSLESKMNGLQITLYEDENKALQGIADILNENPSQLESKSSKLWNFFSPESWENYKNNGVGGLNLAALSLMKVYGLDSDMRNRMGMLVLASRSQFRTQNIHGLIGTARSVSINNNGVDIIGVDESTQEPVVSSLRINENIVKNALAKKDSRGSMSMGQWIGEEWNSSTPENGMLGWISWLNEPGSPFMSGLRGNFATNMAEYQPIITAMPGGTVEEKENNFIQMRERAIADSIIAYTSPEVMAAYNEMGGSLEKDFMYTPKRVDIHLDVLRRMMLDPAWPSRPYTQDGPTRHFQKGLYVDNDGGMGTFGGELVPGTTDTYVYFNNTSVSAMSGTDIMNRTGAGESELGHVRLTRNIAIESETDASNAPLDIVVPWVLFDLDQDEHREGLSNFDTAMRGFSFQF